MCGRYTGVIDPDAAARQYRAVWAEPPTAWKPDYNICPTRVTAIVVQEEQRKLILAQWGFQPPWKKDGPLTNVWGESAPDKRTLATPFRSQRCIVPATGFYEWKKIEGDAKAEGKAKAVKEPYRIVPLDAPHFSIAGLYEDEKTKTGEWVRRFTMLLTAANEVVAPIHKMQPVFLSPQAVEQWLDPDAGVEDLRALCVLYPASRTRAYRVATTVNSVKNSGPALIEPVTEASSPA